MRVLYAFISYFSSILVFVTASRSDCKCTPDSNLWPSEAEWSALNSTISGALIKSVPPASVCYSDQPNYNEEACAFIRSEWFNSTWHATDPVSIDYPIWANNSCNPIWPNGTSLTGDINAGKKGCSIGNYPVYVVNATTADQVGKALKWAGNKNIRVVVKSTGHSHLGRSTGYGSLSIWTHNFRGIEHIKSFKPISCPINGPQAAARVAAGQSGIEVQAEMAKYNSVIVTGANPDVGLIGWLTGGGHGTLSTTYGMGADNLLEATIVMPDGEVLIANPCKNSDVFFAIRGGGGGTFGVVIEAVVKAFPTPSTTLHTFSLSSLNSNVTTEFWDMMGFIHSEMPRLKEGGMQGYYYIMGPPSIPTLSLLWGFFLYDKQNGTVENLMAPIEKRLENQAHLFAYQSNITHSDTYFELYGSTYMNEPVASGGSAFGSWLLSPESLADSNVTAQVFAEIGPSTDPLAPNGPVSNPSLLGLMIAHPNEPSYYPDVISMNVAWRKTLVHFMVVESWLDGMPQSIIDSVYRDITVNKTQPLRNLSPDTGAYFNEPDSYEPEWQNAFFGKHYARLVEIKQKYDPMNVLWCRQCVGSEALVEQQDGKICRSHYRRTEDSKGGKRGWSDDSVNANIDDYY